MYYVIKKNITNPTSCFMGFAAPKYIAAKNSDNVIFEFTKDGKITRKWVKKEEVVLLTEDKEFFIAPDYDAQNRDAEMFGGILRCGYGAVQQIRQKHQRGPKGQGTANGQRENHCLKYEDCI